MGLHMGLGGGGGVLMTGDFNVGFYGIYDGIPTEMTTTTIIVTTKAITLNDNINNTNNHRINNE